MSRLTRTADRLAAGSRTYARRLGNRAAAWCARGRRNDLTGWRAALGPILRTAGLIVAALIAWLIVRRRPWLLWLLSGWWTIAAWRAGKPAVEEPEEPPTNAPAGRDPKDVRSATLEWIWRLVGDAQGVHLRDLLTHAHAHGMFEGLDVTDLRGHLERWGIPVRNRVRVRGLGVTVGIHRDDLPAPSGPSPEEQAQETPEPQPHML